MGEKTIYITEHDIGRLEGLFNRTRVQRRDQDALDILEEEIGKCKVVGPDEIPPDVVTINSRVRLRDLGADKEMIVRLVLPHMADLSEGRLSVVSPIGTAILGYAAGDIIEWQVRSVTKKISVEEVLYQPEAAGDYHL